MHKRIDSSQNPAIKSLLQLREKSRVRKKEQRFLIEGILELELAFKAGYHIAEVYVCTSIITMEAFKITFGNWLSQVQIIEVSIEVYEKLAYRTSTEGVLGVAKLKNLHIDGLELKTDNPLILVAEAPEKPGNIGAILRTADAAKVDAVIIANPKTDLFNPNVIRSSVGGVFTNTIATGTTTEIVSFLQQRNINIYCAILQSSISYHEQDFTNATAIVVGTEHEGLSEEWRKNTTQNIIIPMGGSIDSMNVSVAAGILIFEAKRQRGF